LAWHEKQKTSKKGIVIKNIKDIVGAGENYFSNLYPEHNQIFFIEGSNGHQPYLLTGISYTPKDRYENPAHTDFFFEGERLGQTTSSRVTLHRLPAANITMDNVFEHLDVQLSTKELMADSEEKLLFTNQLTSSVGEDYDAAILQ